MPAAAAEVTVRTLQANDLARWDAYVQAHPDASFFHRAGWKRVIEDAFGHRSHFLLAERGGELAGVLPLVEIDSRLFGHSLGRCRSALTVASWPITTRPGAHSTKPRRPWPDGSGSARSNTATRARSMPTGRPRICTSRSRRPSNPKSRPT